MNPQQLSQLLLAVGKLAESGVDVDQAAVTALCKAAIEVAPKLTSHEVTTFLWVFGVLAEAGRDSYAGRFCLPRRRRTL